MSKVKFKLNRQGVSELMKSSEMQSVLVEKAKAVRLIAGEGYTQDVHVGKNRSNAMVYAETIQAKRDNLKNNTLVKALNS